jgi:sarcosine oxidase gamma subunit
LSDEALFAEPDELFTTVREMRAACAATASAATVDSVSLSDAGATQTLIILAGLADSVPSSTATQIELIARSISLGALRTIVADTAPSSEEGD